MKKRRPTRITIDATENLLAFYSGGETIGGIKINVLFR